MKKTNTILGTLTMALLVLAIYTWPAGGQSPKGGGYVQTGPAVLSYLASGNPPAVKAAYVDSFHDILSTCAVPANIATYQTASGGSPIDDSGQYILTVTSGAAGATTLTLTGGDSAKVAGMGSVLWPCVIKHTDGSYAFNVVRANNGSTTITLHKPLAKAAANVYPLWDAVNSQHMTRNAYRAWAEMVYNQNAAACTAERFVDKGCYTFQTPQYQQLWAKNAALTAYGQINVNNVVTSLAPETLNGNYFDASFRLMRASVEPAGVQVGVHLTGHGIEGTINTQGVRGYIETYVVTTDTGSTTPANVGSAKLDAYAIVNGVEQATPFSTTTFSDYMQRVVIPVNGYDSVRLSIVAVANYPFFIKAHNTRLWVSESPDRPLIDKDANVLCVGDSWFGFYSGSDTSVVDAPTTSNGAFAARLQELMTAAGGRGTVYNRSHGGMTTAWAKAWLPKILADLKAQGVKIDVVVTNFITNDANGASAQATFKAPDGSTKNNQIANTEQWRANLGDLKAMIAANGSQPIILGPAGTASASQAQVQLQWLRAARPGVQGDAMPQATTAELADATSFINAYGKRNGKVASNITTGVNVYAQGSTAASAWANPQSNRLDVIEPRVNDLVTYGTGFSYIVMSSTVGNSISTPDTTALGITGSIDMDAFVAPSSWGSGSTQILMVKESVTTEWRFTLMAGGQLQFIWYETDGTQRFIQTTAVTGFTAGTAKYVRVSMDASNATGQFYTSDDGTTWTTFEGVKTANGAPASTSIRNTTSRVDVASLVGLGFNTIGNVYRARVYSGIRSAGGSLVSDINPASATAGASTFLDATSGGTVTLVGASIKGPPTSLSLVDQGTGNLRQLKMVNGVLSVVSGYVGYATGAGGTVTQATSRTTGVTINKVSGAITLFSAAGSATPATFTVTDSTVAATDVIHLSQQSGTDAYILLVTNVAAGSFKVTAYTTGGTTTEAPVINFVVIKAVISDASDAFRSAGDDVAGRIGFLPEVRLAA